MVSPGRPITRLTSSHESAPPEVQMDPSGWRNTMMSPVSMDPVQGTPRHDQNVGPWPERRHHRRRMHSERLDDRGAQQHCDDRRQCERYDPLDEPPPASATEAGVSPPRRADRRFGQGRCAEIESPESVIGTCRAGRRRATSRPTRVGGCGACTRAIRRRPRLHLVARRRHGDSEIALCVPRDSISPRQSRRRGHS